MLELKKITKVYETGNIKQKALDNVSVSFRKSEFASILGPSGSGKTTLLNIIGGLDKYTSGDLIINNVSTKKYKDSNWDSYRNHRIGFVFQSYNLISHQTVLQNVVLALTLSGVSKKEGIARAKKALIEVGLKDHMSKRPNQLSGGQMQRVAIARALVNDPDILLADEPTGALDSDTSVQIMNILKKISNNKLVIMVTHNPDLAKEYSNRIITLKDGKITSDTNPYTETEETEDIIQNSKTKKTSMSFLTALSLSFNNLMTKKARTILVSFAGSIGIIGIALILSLSTGFQNYIDKLQEDTLSSYPLTITSETADMTSMLLSMVGTNDDSDVKEGVVKEQQFVTSMFSSLSTNDLTNFKKYLEAHEKQLNKHISTIKYGYSIDPLIYTKNSKNKLAKINPNSMFSTMYGNSGISNMYSSYASIFSQMLDDQKSLDEQYNVLAGRWPTKYNEMVIVLPDANSISDLLVYFLGLRDIEELYDIITKSMSGEKIDINNEPLELTYDDLMNIDLRLLNQADTYKYNEKYKIYEDMSEDEEYMNNLYDKAVKIKIVGVVAAKDGVTSMALTPGVAYTSELIDYISDYASKTDIVKKQLENKDVDVFSNIKFEEKEEQNRNQMEFEDLISIDNEMLESAFNIKLDENQIKSMTTNYMTQISESITADITPAKKDFDSTLQTLAKNLFSDYIKSPKNTVKNPMLNVELPVIYTNDVDTIVTDFLKKQENVKLISNLESKYVIPANVFTNTYSTLLSGLLKGYIIAYNQQDTSVTTDENNKGAIIVETMIDTTINGFMTQAVVVTASQTLAQNMTEAVMQKTILTEVGELSGKLMGSLADAFDVDPDKIAKAFKFDLSEDELRRIMTAMISEDDGSSAKSNLISLGYQSKDDPSSIAFYFNSFDSKEYFLDFIDKYNDDMGDDEEKVIKYTDATGLLMSSVKKIVNSVSYVLIAFVSVSLVVSSIMIGIITYISVLERTKEIGILRAIGASKRNISSIFNAETFIVGLLSGFMGIGVTLLLIPIINSIIHSLTNNLNLSATISVGASAILITLSVILTLIGGLIPSKKASKQDPVVALRTE